MPKTMDRETRRVVDQYFNIETQEVVDPEDIQGYEPVIGQYAAKAKATLERLLDECVTADANTFQGRTAIVTVGRIRQLIAEGLS